MRNYPICLPKVEKYKNQFARIFATTTTQDNCRILDTFVKLEDPKNCSKTTKKSSQACGMSPDKRDCQWVPQSDSFLTSSSSRARIQLLGMASGFSTCQDVNNDSKVHFSFYSITKKIVNWMTSKIYSGECPELFDWVPESEFHPDLELHTYLKSSE